MSWYHPITWNELLASVDAGFAFNSTRLAIRGESALTVCGHYATRGHLYGHLDDFARHIIASHDALNARYLASNRYDAERPDDVAYYIARDGNALVYVTRAGKIEINPMVDSAPRRYRDAVTRLLPHLELQTLRRLRRESEDRALGAIV